MVQAVSDRIIFGHVIAENQWRCWKLSRMWNHLKIKTLSALPNCFIEIFEQILLLGRTRDKFVSTQQMPCIKLGELVMASLDDDDVDRWCYRRSEFESSNLGRSKIIIIITIRFHWNQKCFHPMCLFQFRNLTIASENIVRVCKINSKSKQKNFKR